MFFLINRGIYVEMLQKGSGPNGKARASLDLQTHASTVEPASREQDCICASAMQRDVHL